MIWRVPLTLCSPTSIYAARGNVAGGFYDNLSLKRHHRHVSGFQQPHNSVEVEQLLARGAGRSMLHVDGESRFRVSPQILGPLGLEQLQDPGLAVLELIKNSWDADAADVSVNVSSDKANSTIEVSDSGIGMSRTDFESHWLVLGDTHKRRMPFTGKGRPVIGEKGLGRLACFALGSRLRITSRADGHPAFAADVDWDEIVRAPSLDAVPIRIETATRNVGTTVTIEKLKRQWSENDTDLLVRHVEFLAMPAKQDKFVVNLRMNGASRTVNTRPDILEQFAEAEFEIKIGSDGAPLITKATVGDKSYPEVAYRPLPPRNHDPRLAGATIRSSFLGAPSDHPIRIYW